jgi:hypothetical protein
LLRRVHATEGSQSSSLWRTRLGWRHQDQSR